MKIRDPHQVLGIENPSATRGQVLLAYMAMVGEIDLLLRPDNMRQHAEARRIVEHAFHTLMRPPERVPPLRQRIPSVLRIPRGFSPLRPTEVVMIGHGMAVPSRMAPRIQYV